MSRSIVREGVSWRYLFQTWMTICCGEERGGSDEFVNVGTDVGFAGVLCVAAGDDIEPDAARAAGGGFDAATGVEVLLAAEDDTGFLAMLIVSIEG
jgi:hypothetical protein